MSFKMSPCVLYKSPEIVCQTDRSVQAYYNGKDFKGALGIRWMQQNNLAIQIFSNKLERV